MARLAFHVELHAGLANHVGGEVIVVEDDSHVFSELEHRQFGVLDVPGLSVKDARERYLRDGVPDAARAADRAEHERFVADMVAAGDDKARRAAVKPLNPELLANVADFPPRAVVLDLTRLDAAKRQAVRDNWSALRSVAGDAKASAKAMVVAQLEATYGTVSKETLGKKTGEIIEGLAQAAQAALDAKRPVAAQTIDMIRDSLIDASRVGRDLVESEALAKVPVPEAHVLDAASLDAITVRRA